ncbi:efflux transporter outer membrane subunit [Caenimonas sp. SL110]|uniref:efflux transporter outer membrane subunit n=1 Tax=Caenimonas sp. SL110 TaxID=1450524 RepID=UPI00065451CD|nr:efflux transporter outer membrane subunit [Caenimonas sp. SL110]
MLTHLPGPLAGLALALGGCASGPAPTGAPLPLDVPAAWSQGEAADRAGPSALSQWWLRLDDPLLARLVADALRSNHTIAIAQASLAQARAQRETAAAGLLPALDGSASAGRSRSGGGSASNSFRIGLDAAWELDVFGGKQSAVAAGVAVERAGAANLGDARVSIAAEVALGYIALRSGQARLAIALDNLASQQELLQITQWRLQAGLVSSLEAEQSRAAAEQSRAQVTVLRAANQQLVHALATLTGRPPMALSGQLDSPGPIPAAPAGMALSLPADTLRQRPDIRAAEYQVVAASARVSQAHAQTLPSFRLAGSLGLNALTLGSLTSGASVASSLLAGLAWPLFDGGAGRAQVRAQQAAMDQAVAAYRGAVLTALKEVEDALVALRSDRERLAHLQQAAGAAANAALMARQRYSSGLVDFQVVLETQRNQLSTQDSVAGAAADVTADHVRLYKALGGGWQPDDDTTLAPTPAGSAPS